MTIDPKVVHQIRYYLRHGFTQEAVAAKLGISRDSVVNCNNRSPHHGKGKKLAKLLKAKETEPIPYTKQDKRFDCTYCNLGRLCHSSILAASPEAARDRLIRHLGKEIDIMSVKEIKLDL